MNAQIQALNSQITAETNRINQNKAATISNLDRIKREYRDKQIIGQAEVQETKSELTATLAASSSAQAKLKRYQSAAKAGAISQNQSEEVKLIAQQQWQKVLAAKAKLTANL